jgi:hypothetical protein
VTKTKAENQLRKMYKDNRERVHTNTRERLTEGQRKLEKVL